MITSEFVSLSMSKIENPLLFGDALSKNNGNDV